MSSYQTLTHLFNTDALEICCVNSQGEVSVVRKGKNPDGDYIEIKTAQDNGYLRINVYYEDGTIEEYYEC